MDGRENHEEINVGLSRGENNNMTGRKGGSDPVGMMTVTRNQTWVCSSIESEEAAETFFEAYACQACRV